MGKLGLQPEHIQEQVLWRAFLCKDDCAKTGKCKDCGCSVPGKWYVTQSCNKGTRFPNLMNLAQWEIYKKENKIEQKMLGVEMTHTVLTKLVEHIEYYNKLSPFPLWDSYYVEELKKKLEMNDIKKDTEPVVCCHYCKSLYIVEDEQGNDKCLKCKNIVTDDHELFASIHQYLRKYGEIWGLKEKSDESETS